MQKKCYEDLGDGIEVHELDKTRRFEAAGLGIIDMSQLEYCAINQCGCIWRILYVVRESDKGYDES